MIDLNLLQLMDAKYPRMNPRLVEGLAVSQVGEVEYYIHNIFKCAAESFPPGLKYLGGKRCSPLEQYQEITRPLKPSRSFDMLRSDVYLMKYLFSFNGVPLRPHYLFLPFVSDGGLIHIKGAQYQITPVLGGKVYNIERNNIYMPTPRLRMGFSMRMEGCVVNDKTVFHHIITSYLYNGMKKTQRSKLLPTLIHYILAEYGLSVTLSQMFNVDAKVGKEELDELDFNEWKVFKSRQFLGNGKKIGDPVSNIRIAVHNSQYYHLLETVMTTIFYIIDNCVENTNEVEDLNNPILWMFLLDRFIFKIPNTEKKQFEKMDAHLKTVRSFMDPITKKILAMDNIHCTTIFDLFKYICLNYQDIIIHNDVGTMYYKELTTIKYLMYHVVYNIFIMMYELQKLPENLLTAKKIDAVIMKFLKKDKILTVGGHGELSSVSIASDCKIYGATCNMISHNKATTTGNSKRNKKVTTDPGLLLHESQAEVGTYQWITNHGPLGRDKINCFLPLGEHDYIMPSKELESDLAAMRELLNIYKKPE